MRVTRDHVQRRLEFMRHHTQELVFDLVRPSQLAGLLLDLLEEFCMVNGNRDLSRQRQ